MQPWTGPPQIGSERRPPLHIAGSRHTVRANDADNADISARNECDRCQMHCHAGCAIWGCGSAGSGGNTYADKYRGPDHGRARSCTPITRRRHHSDHNGQLPHNHLMQRIGMCPDQCARCRRCRGRHVPHNRVLW